MESCSMETSLFRYRFERRSSLIREPIQIANDLDHNDQIIMIQVKAFRSSKNLHSIASSLAGVPVS